MLIPDAADFPLATLVVNVVGALLLGVLAARLPSTSDARVFLGTGILGGFTTYSAFAVGTIQLWAQNPLLGGMYALLTMVLGVWAAIAGMRLGGRRRSTP